MKKYFFLISLSVALLSKASDKDSTSYYNLPDSIKAVQFMAEINVSGVHSSRFILTGIKTDAISLVLAKYRNGKRGIRLSFPVYSQVLAKGSNVKVYPKFSADWNYPWSDNKTYKLLIATAADSAGNFSIYTGYIWLPEENKWKLIATCRITGRWNTLQQPAIVIRAHRKSTSILTTGQVWVQRNNGSWKNLKEETLPPPQINLAGHVDSAFQLKKEIKQIEDSIAAGKTDAIKNEQGVYYSMLKEGTGRQVSIDDTVVVHYKGYLFSDGTEFDQTKDKPATFPLKRLIRGWQIGVPLCKVGGKIKLVIPSDMAYSIRTRAAKIPPNSILVFEIEVVDVKPPL